LTECGLGRSRPSSPTDGGRRGDAPQVLRLGARPRAVHGAQRVRRPGGRAGRASARGHRGADARVLAVAGSAFARLPGPPMSSTGDTVLPALYTSAPTRMQITMRTRFLLQ